jgi:hypothetical protein
MPSSGSRKSPCQTIGQRALKIHASTRKKRGAAARPNASRHPSRITQTSLPDVPVPGEGTLPHWHARRILRIG